MEPESDGDGSPGPVPGPVDRAAQLRGMLEQSKRGRPEVQAVLQDLVSRDGRPRAFLLDLLTKATVQRRTAELWLSKLDWSAVPEYGAMSRFLRRPDATISERVADLAVQRDRAGIGL